MEKMQRIFFLELMCMYSCWDLRRYSLINKMTTGSYEKGIIWERGLLAKTWVFKNKWKSNIWTWKIPIWWKMEGTTKGEIGWSLFWEKGQTRGHSHCLGLHFLFCTEEAPLQREASEPLFPQLPEGGHPALPRLGSSHLAEPSWSRPPTPTSFSAAVLLMRSQVFSIFIYVSHKCSCMWRPVSCRLPAYDIPWNHRRACGLLILIDFGWWVTFRKTNVAGHPPCPSRSE